ncbi:hypothetical protein HKX48_009175 [Thoreauomyces humboldtii]|nr:hypothetical protein HKX48_009175 [Thoreauomyces humboldtii]
MASLFRTSHAPAVPAPDVKPSHPDAQSYAVQDDSQGLYPTATEHYVPPLAEPASNRNSSYDVSGAVASAPPVTELPAQTGMQVGGAMAQSANVVVQPTAVFVGTSVNFHIYREGWVSRDCRILQADKKTVAYHIDYPYSFFGSWHVNMRRTGSKGPTVFLITKSAMGSDFTIADPSNPSLSTKVTRSGGVIGKRKHMFVGFDGKKYAWKGSDLGGDLKLVCYPNKEIMAYYHRKKHAWAKEGRLEVFAGGQHIMDLVVATGFCVEEYERQHH